MSIAYIIIYMTACLIFELHKVNFHNLVNHIQHVYYVYGVPYIQVAAIGQICSYNIWHYAVKAFTA